MNSKFLCALIACVACVVHAQQYSISFITNGFPTNPTVTIKFTNYLGTGVGTLEGQVEKKKWEPIKNYYTTQAVGQVSFELPAEYPAYRVRWLPIGPGGFLNVAKAYGNISTVAGIGPVPEGTNHWLPVYEGAFATNVPLSNPRQVAADGEGNIYIVEKDSHAVSVVDTNGVLRTAVGTRTPGYLLLLPGIEPPGTVVSLQNPSGLYFTGGRLYIFDAGNGRIISYANGFVRALYSRFAIDPVLGIVPQAFTNGAGLWVAADESEAYFTDGDTLYRWRPVQGLEMEAFGFGHLTSLNIDPRNRIFVTDGPAHRAYRVDDGAYLELPLAGSGRNVRHGIMVGDARMVPMPGPSAIEFLPIGGYLVANEEGARVWYVDTEGDTAVIVHGRPATARQPAAHSGDGEWFRKRGRRPIVGEVRSIDLAPNNDLFLLENGYVRRIEFLRRAR